MEVFLKQSAEFLPILMQGLRLTVIVTVGSLALSTVLGVVWALMRVSGVPLLAGIAKTVVNVIRGIPIIVQLFYIYFVLPDFGISLTAVQAAIIGLGIAYSAYQSENFRAGIEDHGRRAGAAGQADRVLDLPEHHRVHARRRALPLHEHATHPACLPSRK